jgi:S-adenosylmethionine hydrolase
VITRVARTYGEAGAGVFVIIGSMGLIEISIANGSAAAVLGLKRGDRVRVE